ncbi:MAG: RNA methyltransferase [Lachnospiraceae bacterium]|nr:RNA methyltransferase [Lachnospiraceae bacterium]
MITSLSNNSVRRVVQLCEKASLRRKEERFVCEGIKMFMEAPSSLVEKVYISESLIEKLKGEYAFGEYDKGVINEKLKEAGYEEVSDAVMDKMADTKTPQGILTILKMPEHSIEDMVSGKAFVVVCENVKDPGNLGTIIRTAEGAGVTGVVLSKECVDIFNPKTIRATMGSVYRVKFTYVEDIVESVNRLKKEGVKFYATHLKGTAFYDEVDWRGKTGFFVGNEANGLTDKLSNTADNLIKIPMEGKLESLNAAVASAVVMYEAHRQRCKSY